jgi:hypothetical protein
MSMEIILELFEFSMYCHECSAGIVRYCLALRKMIDLMG